MTSHQFCIDRSTNAIKVSIALSPVNWGVIDRGISIGIDIDVLNCLFRLFQSERLHCILLPVSIIEIKLKIILFPYRKKQHIFMWNFQVKEICILFMIYVTSNGLLILHSVCYWSLLYCCYLYCLFEMQFIASNNVPILLYFTNVIKCNDVLVSFRNFLS